jgi:hypothetical protein
MAQKWRGRAVIDEETRQRSIVESFVELGAEGNEGKAFAIVLDDLKREFGGDITEMIDRLKDRNFGYTPTIWRDHLTGNYLVERRNSNGKLYFRAGALMQRVA